MYQNDSTDEKEKAAESALVKAWAERLDNAKKFYRDEHKQWNRWRDYVSGKAGEDFQVNVNLIASTINTVIPHIYARNPDVAVLPAEAVGDERYAHVADFARTLEIILSREMGQAFLKPQAKRAARSAMTLCMGVVKVDYQTVTENDPQIQRRIEDARDNLARIKRMMQDAAEDNPDTEEMDASRAELEQQLRALQEQVEVVVSEGLTIDLVPADDYLVDPTLKEMVENRWANWQAQRLWYTADQARETFGMDEDAMKGATVYVQRGGDEADADKTDDRPQGWLAVWEIWHKQSNTVYTLMEGKDCWVREPFTPNPAGERFYPFFILAFNWVDGQFFPLSDVEQWHELQDEYNRTRSAYAEHRRRAIPSRIFNQSIVKPTDAEKLKNPESNELVGVDAGNAPIDSLVSLVPYPRVDMGLYDTSIIRGDLEIVSGLQDAARGSVAEAKTATEAEILQAGLVTRLTERQDAIEEWVQDIAQYSAELLLQVLTPDQAKRIAGDEAVWPQMSRAEMYSLINVKIRAGTSGKPNRVREQQTWAKLLPLIQSTVLQISQLRAQGQDAIAQSMIELLRETLRRADERLDIERFIPQEQPGQGMQQPGQQGMQQPMQPGQQPNNQDLPPMPTLEQQP